MILDFGQGKDSQNIKPKILIDGQRACRARNNVALLWGGAVQLEVFGKMSTSTFALHPRQLIRLNQEFLTRGYAEIWFGKLS